MATFIKEDSEKLSGKLYKVPEKLVTKAKQIDATLGSQYPTSDGAKRIKKIANYGEYNKKSDKKRPKDGTYLSFAEIKKADHEMRHMNRSQNDLTNQLNGGEDFRNFYAKTLDNARNSVAKVPEIEQVKPNNVKADKIAKDPMKPMKTDNGVVNFHEGKTIYISENKLHLLKEDINAQEYITFLQSIGKIGSLPNPSMSNEDIICKIEDCFIQYYLDERLLENPQAFDENLEFSNIKDFCIKYLNQLGKKFFAKCWKMLNYFGFIKTVSSQNGKIYIERAISLNSLSDAENYEGLGNSWCWKVNGSEAYFGNGSTNIILKGYVNADDVNWEKTVILNSYELNEQKELRTNVNSPIEIFGIKTNENEINLKNSIIVNSGNIDTSIE